MHFTSAAVVIRSVLRLYKYTILKFDNCIHLKKTTNFSPKISERVKIYIFINSLENFMLSTFPRLGTLLVAQLVEALGHKPEGRGFNTRWSFRPHYGPGLDLASNRNEYQEYFLGVKVAG